MMDAKKFSEERLTCSFEAGKEALLSFPQARRKGSGILLDVSGKQALYSAHETIAADVGAFAFGRAPLDAGPDGLYSR